MCLPLSALNLVDKMLPHHVCTLVIAKLYLGQFDGLLRHIPLPPRTPQCFIHAPNRQVRPISPFERQVVLCVRKTGERVRKYKTASDMQDPVYAGPTSSLASTPRTMAARWEKSFYRMSRRALIIGRWQLRERVCAKKRLFAAFSGMCLAMLRAEVGLIGQ